jgi:hypothetical protein
MLRKFELEVVLDVLPPFKTKEEKESRGDGDELLVESDVITVAQSSIGREAEVPSADKSVSEFIGDVGGLRMGGVKVLENGGLSEGLVDSTRIHSNNCEINKSVNVPFLSFGTDGIDELVCSI